MTSKSASNPIRNRQTQIIPSSYTNPGFRLLLDDFFGKGKYTLNWRRDHYEIAADRKLTEEEKEKLKSHYKTSAPNSAVEGQDTPNDEAVETTTTGDIEAKTEASSVMATDEDIEVQKQNSVGNVKINDKKDDRRTKQPSTGLKKFFKGFLNNTKGSVK